MHMQVYMRYIQYIIQLHNYEHLFVTSSFVSLQDIIHACYDADMYAHTYKLNQWGFILLSFLERKTDNPHCVQMDVSVYYLDYV